MSVWVRRATSAPFRDLGDEIVVALPGREEVEILGGTGVVVWRLLDTPLEIGELVTAVAELYRASLAVVDVDVRSLVDRLAGVGALEVTDVDR